MSQFFLKPILRKISLLSALCLASLSPSACNQDNKLRGSSEEKELKPSPTPAQDVKPGGQAFRGAERVGIQVDIIFLLDTSDSMDEKVKKVFENLNGLIANYLQKVQTLDYQIIMVGEKELTIKGPRIGRVKKYVGSNSALSAAEQVLSGKETIEKTDPSGPELKIRESATKELVVVSDDDSDVKMAEFLAWLDDNKTVASDVFVNGIIANVTKCGRIVLGLPTPFGSNIGQTYIDLANNPRTKGVIGDLCQYTNSSAWSGIFDKLGNALSQFKTAPAVTLQLGEKPADPSKIAVKINGKLVDPNLIEYNEANNSILVKVPSTRNDVLEVAY